MSAKIPWWVKVFWAAWLCSPAALAQYQAERTGAPPSELAPGLAQALEKTGFRIVRDGSVYCEIWFRSQLPRDFKSSVPNVTLSTIPAGTLVGVIRYEVLGSDRRGQPIRGGLYTLRYALLPANMAHLGAAPQRDFLLLAPAAEDRDPELTPSLEALVALSRKASGTPHPAVLSVRKAAPEATGFSQHGDDWVLESQLGDTAIALILIGTAGL